MVKEKIEEEKGEKVKVSRVREEEGGKREVMERKMNEEYGDGRGVCERVGRAGKKKRRKRGGNIE